jgi:hypothetical protein
LKVKKKRITQPSFNSLVLEISLTKWVLCCLLTLIFLLTNLWYGKYFLGLEQFAVAAHVFYTDNKVFSHFSLQWNFFLCFGIFIFSLNKYFRYNIGIQFYSVGSTSVILVLVVVGQSLTWVAGFLRLVCGEVWRLF